MNDLRYAFRQLLKNPGLTAVEVLSLASGNGARVLDCGGNPAGAGATPLSRARRSLKGWRFFGAPRHSKAVSPLRSATALQDAAAPSTHASY
jgi:hypothetical protein